MEGNQQGWAFSGDQHAAQALHDALDAQQELLEAALARAGEAEQRAAAAEQRAAAAAAAEAAQRRAVAAAEQRAADAEARAVAAEHRAAAAEEHAIKAEAQTATARRQRNEASVRLEGLLQSMAALASQYKEGPSMPPSQQQQQQQQHRQPAHPPPPPYPPAAAPWLLHSPHTPPPVQHDWEQRPAPAGTSREWGGSRTLSVRNLPVLTMDTDRGARNKLRAEFERFGAVESMRFGRNRVNASQGWAFVNYADASSAAAARPAMNGQVVPWLGATRRLRRAEGPMGYHAVRCLPISPLPTAHSTCPSDRQHPTVGQLCCHLRVQAPHRQQQQRRPRRHAITRAWRSAAAGSAAEPQQWLPHPCAPATATPVAGAAAQQQQQQRCGSAPSSRERQRMQRSSCG